MRNETFVAIDLDECYEYPNPPFNPPEIYPEFNCLDIISEIDSTNQIYNKVRNVLQILELDKGNLNTTKWNPLSELIKTNENIVIKPNLVLDRHPFGEVGTSCTITNASLVRPIIDYIILATSGRCNITICDAPVQSANWQNLIEKSGFIKLVDFYSKKGIHVNLLDLRIDTSIIDDEIIASRLSCEKDPLGYLLIDLGQESELKTIIDQYKKLRITDYGTGTVQKRHNPIKNEYCISKTVLNADLFINVPKIKTHRKAGMTCALKNLVGINGDKKGIAHHRIGSKKHGGDEYQKFQLCMWLKWHIWELMKKDSKLLPIAKLTKKIYLKVIGEKSLSDYSMISKDVMEGSWHGNDTIWRCILDINKILLYADKNGLMSPKAQRKYLCIVDGIVSAECEGPMQGTPKKTGIVMAGFNPISVDKICAEIMGFDYDLIPQIKEGFENRFWKLACFSADEVETNVRLLPNKHFIASYGWKGHIERNRD